MWPRSYGSGIIVDDALFMNLFAVSLFFSTGWNELIRNRFVVFNFFFQIKILI